MPPSSCLTRWVSLGLLLLSLALVGCTGAVDATTPGVPKFRGRGATPTPVVIVTPRATSVSPRATIRSYTDAQGRAITLFQGRAVGRRGDWGWSHIIGKHLRGEWLDGGPMTNFSVIGVTTPEEVQEIIGRTLKEDPRPDSSAGGRREYRLAMPATRYEVLAVVGSDGAIITSYPDTPRGGG